MGQFFSRASASVAPEPLIADHAARTPRETAMEPPALTDPMFEDVPATPDMRTESEGEQALLLSVPASVSGVPAKLLPPASSHFAPASTVPWEKPAGLR